jgi:hypothetical protein
MWNYEAVLAGQTRSSKIKSGTPLRDLSERSGTAIANSPLVSSTAAAAQCVEFSKHCKRTCSPRMCNSG